MLTVEFVFIFTLLSLFSAIWLRSPFFRKYLASILVVLSLLLIPVLFIAWELLKYYGVISAYIVHEEHRALILLQDKFLIEILLQLNYPGVHTVSTDWWILDLVSDFLSKPITSRYLSLDDSTLYYTPLEESLVELLDITRCNKPFNNCFSPNYDNPSFGRFKDVPLPRILVYRPCFFCSSSPIYPTYSSHVYYYVK